MDSLAQRLRHQSMDWLAQREYSRHELARKLERRFFSADKKSANKNAAKRHRASTAEEAADTDLSFAAVTATDADSHARPNANPTAHQLIEATLDWLVERQFQSDSRCATLYVRSHIERGHGVLRIRQDLVFIKRLAPELVAATMEASGCDWFALAAATLAKRFRQPAADLKEKAKQLRFLQQRGFNSDQCYHALGGLEDTDN